MKNSLLIIFLFLLTSSVYSQTYYYNSGDPTVLSNWGNEPGGGGSHPSSFSNAGFVIEPGKNAIVNSPWSISFAQLAVSSGAVLTANSAITFSNTSTFKLDSAALYIHNNAVNAATTIFAGNENFHTKSSIKIDNWSSANLPVTANVSYNPSQYYFGNLEINWSTCPGDWYMGFGSYTLCSNDLRISSTGKGRIIPGAISSPVIMGVKNYYQTGGELDLSFGSSVVNGYAVMLSIKGNFEKTGGSIDANGASSFGMIYFTRGFVSENDTIHQTFYNSGTIRRVRFQLAISTKLRLLSNMPLTTNNTLCGFYTEGGSVLECGTFQITGVGPFSFPFGGNIKLGSPFGFKTGTSQGNIITTGVKTLHQVDTIEYNGIVPQVTGDSISSPFPCIIKINNPSGVTLSKTIRLAYPVKFTNGKLNLGNYDLIADQFLTISGINANNFFNTDGTGYYKTYINGGGQRDLFLGSKTFSPMRITFFNTSSDTFSFKITDGFIPGALPPDSAYCVRKTWHMVDRNPGNASANIQFQWMQTDNGVNFNYAQQNLIAKYESGVLKYAPMPATQGGNFVNPPAPPASVSSTMSSFNSTAFTEDSYFIIGNNNGVYDTYYFNEGDASIPSNWKKNQDGSGSSPLSFDEYATYNIQQNKTAVFDSPVIFSNKTKLRAYGNSVITSNQAITNYGVFELNDSSTYNHNNNYIAASTIFAGSEMFSVRSNYNILMWSDTAHKVYDGVNGVFGNLTINFNNLSRFGFPAWSGNAKEFLCMGNFKYIQSSGYEFAPVGRGYVAHQTRIEGNLQLGDSINFPDANPVLNLSGGTFISADSSAGFLSIKGNIDIQRGGITSQSFPVVAKGRIQFYGSKKHTFYCYKPFLWQTSSMGTANYPNYVHINDTLVLKSDFYNSQSAPFSFRDMWQIDGVFDLDTFSIRSTSVKVGATGRMITRKQEGFFADLLPIQSVAFEPGGALEYAGNETQNFQKPGSYTLTNIPKLKINNPYNVNLNIPGINITDALMLEDGKLICDSINYLTLSDTTEILGGNSNSFISGAISVVTKSVQWKIIPFGKNDNYRKLAIIPNSFSETSWLVKYYDIAQQYGDSIGAGINSISTSEYFIVDRVSGSAPAQIGVPWGPNSGVIDPATTRAAKWNGQFWENSGGVAYSGNADSGFVISELLNSFSPFVVASIDEQPLPVELQSFSSMAIKNDVILDWSTSQEINNSGFDVERKLMTDTVWQKISFIQGAGNSNEIKNYKYEDKNLNSGRYSYRLKQIDYNGNFNYFDLSSEIEVGIPKEFRLSQNYPNPFNPSTKIDFEIPKDAKVNLQIFDMTGRLVASLVNNENYRSGYYTVHFNAGSLSSGTYFFRLSANEFVQTKKMQLIK